MDFLVKFLQFISSLLTVYMWVVVISAVITWVNPDPYNPIVRFLRAVTEPVFLQIRRLIRTNFSGFDIAPMLVIFAIMFVQFVIIGGLVSTLMVGP